MPFKMYPIVLSLLLLPSQIHAQETPVSPGVRLSLQDAITLSLKNNLQVSIARNVRQASKASELIADGAFDLNLSASNNYVRSRSSSTNNSSSPVLPSTTITTETNVLSQRRNTSISLSKPFLWGGTFQSSYLGPNWSSSTLSGTQLFTSSNGSVTGPSLYGPINQSPFPYTGSFSASYTQSLLRGFGPKAAASNYLIAKNTSISADYSFQKSIIDLISATENLYWDLVFAKRNLSNKKLSLGVAATLLKENKIRVQVGTLAAIEVTSSEASVALREQEILTAEAQYLNATDALNRALYPDLSERPSSVEPIDSPTAGTVDEDLEASIISALASRPEIKIAELDLKNKEISNSNASNRLLPQLDVALGYNVVSSSRINESNVVDDLTKKKYPGYSLGFTFSIPVFNRSARGSAAQASASLRQSELSFKDIKLGIQLEVQQSLRNLQTAQKAVAAALKTRQFREKDLQAEQKKFQNGMSTNFLVQSKQNDFDASLSSELQAQINFAKATTAFAKAKGNLIQSRNLNIE